MKISDIRTLDEDLEIIVLTDNGYIGNTLVDFKVEGGKVYFTIDASDDIEDAISTYKERN